VCDGGGPVMKRKPVLSRVPNARTLIEKQFAWSASLRAEIANCYLRLPLPLRCCVWIRMCLVLVLGLMP
jgi:hypothetical protein